MALPVRGQRTRTQVSFGRSDSWDMVGHGVLDFFADTNTADHDCEEVQPRGQSQIRARCARFPFLVYLSRLA